jgi:hypothetical protein
LHRFLLRTTLPYWAKQVINNQAYLPRDFNHDNTVDAADYVVWRKNAGSQSEYDTWRANFGQSSVSPPLPGDFNHDGAIDAADYVVWRKNPGGSPDDYNTWQTSFGATINPASATLLTGTQPQSPAIPEPSSLTLLLLEALSLSSGGACACRRRRAHYCPPRA